MAAKFKLTLFFLISIFLLSPNLFNVQVSADLVPPVNLGPVVSNKVLTKVGNPTAPPPDISTSNNLVNVAQDLHDAYDNCTFGSGNTTGSTIVNSQLSSCLQDFLTKRLYPYNTVSQVSNLDNFEFYMDDYGYCVQCIGFVRQAIILAFGGEDPNLENANGNTPYSWSSMNNNGHILNKVPGPPQPGDIAVNPGDCTTDVCDVFGHINIVKSVGDVTFTALEANFPGAETNYAYCHVSDSTLHPINGYVYFREQ